LGGAHLPRKSLNETLATREACDRVPRALMKEKDVMSSILQSTLHLFAGWRSLLTPSGGTVLSPTAIALMGATGLYGRQQPNDDAAAIDASILNTALGGEFGAVAAYQLAADSGLLQKPVLDIAMQFQGQHKAHADLLTKMVRTLGGQPAEPKKTADYKFPIETLKTQTVVLRFAAGLEQGAASGYLGMGSGSRRPRPRQGRGQHPRRRGDALGDPASGAREEPGTRALHLLKACPRVCSGRRCPAEATAVTGECGTPQ
jgi:Ferritin-like domain